MEATACFWLEREIWAQGSLRRRVADAQLAGQLLERAEAVWNLYGPTETTIWSSPIG